MNAQPQAPRPENPQLARMIDQLQTQIDDAPQMHAEILNELHIIALTLNDLLKEFANLAEHLQQATPTHATPEQIDSLVNSISAISGPCRDFIAETLVMTTDDSGKPAYKVKGFPFSEFGVRVWPEVLPLIGIDPTAVKPGPNPLPPGLVVRALLNENNKPRKIIGKGDGSAVSAPSNNGHNPPPVPEDPPNLPF